MTLFELLFFLIPVFLSFLLWKVIFWHFGLWGTIPAIVLGVGAWVSLWAILDLALDKKAAARPD
jgi:hypothetical protein